MRLGQCYEEINSASSQSPAGLNKLRWKVLWMKLKKEKKKLFESSSGPLQVPPYYDEYSYLQNFDQGSGKDEPENLSRSFSVRFADPSRDSRRKGEV
ncbi:hypothetical protein P3X46_019391 [Hevea brasiliensis]|uniref:Uncharacterized protein n=1 Tax=Hevea brasiliensis TaxID=3981 RepID=A0ABQ9LMD8_HEVBR|nr:hypothetical protein P3X46_019391 [Hevea brasiliensis]